MPRHAQRVWTDAQLALAAEHLPQARETCKRICRKFHHDPDDAESLAVGILMHCAFTFEERLGYAFGCYLDSCLVRWLRTQVRRQRRAYGFRHRFDGPHALGLGIGETEWIGETGRSAPEAFARRELAAAMLASLSARERRLVQRCICDGETLCSAGAEIGLKKSRTGQLVSAALDKLRKRFEDLGA
jgi:DNA-directed RNA polymerase specialized sigma24 family protein